MTTINTKIEQMKTTVEIVEILRNIKVYNYDELHEGQKGFCINKEMWQHNKTAEQVKKMWENNMRVAMFFEYLPKICDVLKKYEGKAYGEKTKKKLADEIENACDNVLYFGYYNNHINIRKPRRRTADAPTLKDHFYDGVDIYIANDKIDGLYNKYYLTDNNNKIRALNVDDFYIWENYINDPYSAVETMRKLLKEINDKEVEVAQLRQQFNKYCVKGIQELDYLSTSYCYDI